MIKKKKLYYLNDSNKILRLQTIFSFPDLNINSRKVFLKNKLFFKGKLKIFEKKILFKKLSKFEKNYQKQLNLLINWCFFTRQSKLVKI